MITRTTRRVRLLVPFLFTTIYLKFCFLYLPEKQLNRDTKLIAIFRRQYYIMLTALEEDIFFQLAVNIMRYYRFQIAI